MKKIANIIPSLENGGAERVVSTLSNHFPKDIEQYIVLFDTTNIDYDFQGQLFDLKVKPTKGFIGKIKILIQRIVKLRKFKKEHKLDVAISHLESTNILNILTRKKEKVVIVVHNAKSKESRGFYDGIVYKILIKMLYNRADKIVVVSQGIKNDLVKNFGVKEDLIKVIYNPFDIEKIQRLALEEIEDEYKGLFSRPVIITTGRLTYQKGHWHLIRAFKKVKEELPNAELVILGQGELEDYLKKLAKGLGISDHVHFLGFKQNPFKFVSKAEIAVSASLFEGFPMVLCECMAAKTPIIYTDCRTGPREALVEDADVEKQTTEIEITENGILVPVLDGTKYNAGQELTKEEKMLAESMLMLMSNRELREKFAENGESRVYKFGTENIILEWQKLFEEITS